MGTLGQLHTRRFATRIGKYGQRPTFWQRRIGPCPNNHNDAVAGFRPDTSCALCGGTGEVYQSMDLPEASTLTRGKVLADVVNISREKAAIELIVGDMRCSFLENDFPLAEGDRLGFDSRVSDHSLLLRRGLGDGDRLRPAPALEVVAVYLAGGELDPENYVLSEDGYQLLFAGLDGPAAPTLTPAAGTQYTVRYRYRPLYRVVRGSFLRPPEATNGDRFPTTCILRLDQQSQADRKPGDP